MEKITVNELKQAVSYVLQSGTKNVAWEKMTDDDFLKLDFSKDLHMGNIRIYNVVIELERSHNLCLPAEFFKLVSDDTVGALMEAINRYLEQKQEATKS